MKTLKEFLEEAIKGWKNVHSDLMHGRSEASAAKNTVVLHKLKKDGTPSGMADAQQSFRTEAEALQHHARVKELNPKSNIKHHLIVNGKVEKTLD